MSRKIKKNLKVENQYRKPFVDKVTETATKAKDAIEYNKNRPTPTPTTENKIKLKDRITMPGFKRH